MVWWFIENWSYRIKVLSEGESHLTRYIRSDKWNWLKKQKGSMFDHESLLTFVLSFFPSWLGYSLISHPGGFDFIESENWALSLYKLLKVSLYSAGIKIYSNSRRSNSSHIGIHISCSYLNSFSFEIESQTILAHQDWIFHIALRRTVLPCFLFSLFTFAGFSKNEIFNCIFIVQRYKSRLQFTFFQINPK